jgi:DNA (cytosine-5)-methyltransferase 1
MAYFQYTLDDLEERSSKKEFSYITFFAGGGGSSCAYKLAGGDVRYMNEFQQIHVDTYLANFPNTVHQCKDIKQVTGADIMEMTGLKKYELDLLDGSPPCPPFSMAGTKREGWEQEKMAYGMKQQNIEDLTWEQIRIAKDLMPKVIVCENVKGLSMDYARDHLNRMVNDFEALGYSITWKILKGHEHGVPQKRERVFMVGVRDDVLDAIEMPFMCLSGVFPDPIKERTSIGDAIDDLVFDEQNDEDAKYLEQAMKDSPKGHWVHGFEEHPDPKFTGCGPCSGVDGVDTSGSYISIGDHIVKPWFQEQIRNGLIAAEDEKHSYYMSRIVPSDLPAHSLTEQGCQPKFMGGNHFHYNGKRIYTPKEMVRLMTLPNDYKMTGDYNDKGARIGLMVAPLCLYYLVEQIKEQILEPWNLLQT